MKEKKYIVDRIEGNKVVLEDDNKGIILIDISLFNENPKDGDVILTYNNIFKIDNKATIERKNKIDALMKGVWE